MRGVPIEINETETPVVSASPAPSAPNADFLQTLANGGGAFAPSNDAKGFTESLTAQNNYEPVEPGQASNVNMILAAINDILGGSEEASAMIG